MRCIGDTEGAFAFDDSDNATALVESATLMVFIIFASASPNPWISHEPEGHTAGIRKHEDSEAFPVTAPHLLICMYCTDLISAVEMCFTSWPSSLWSGFFSNFFRKNFWDLLTAHITFSFSSFFKYNKLLFYFFFQIAQMCKNRIQKGSIYKSQGGPDGQLYS